MTECPFYDIHLIPQQPFQLVLHFSTELLFLLINLFLHFTFKLFLVLVNPFLLDSG